MTHPADIFLSYNREDQATARHFAEGFERAGFSVWWDVTLKSGEDFDQVTEQALESAKAVVVLWSKKSVASRWVRAEATQADRNKTLVPVTIEPCKRPIMFELKQTADLTHWQGDVDDPVWLSFVSDVRQFVMRDRPAESLPPAASVNVAKRRPVVPKAKRQYLTGVAVVLAAVLGASAAQWWSSNNSAEPVTVGSNAEIARFTVPIANAGSQWLGDAGSTEWGRPFVNSIAISDDGKLVAYTAWDYQADGSRKSELYLHRIAAGEARAVSGAESAALPFFSPDGAWLGYSTAEGLMRVPVAGGTPELIASVPKGANRITSVHWGSNDSLVFTTEEALFRVAAGGGATEQLAGIEVDAQRYMYRGVQWLPGNSAVLFYRLSSSDPARAEVVVFDVATRTTRSLLSDAAEPRYFSDDYLLFMRQGDLMAVKFDVTTQAVIGVPILLQANVMQAWTMGNQSSTTGVAQYAISRAGHLVYAAGGMYPRISQGQIQLVSADKTINVGQPLFDIWSVRASPTGDRLLFSAREPNGSVRTHLYDIARDVTSPLIFDSYFSGNAKWSPDGQSVVYISDREGVLNVYSQPLDGSSAPRRLAPSQQLQYALDWSSQGVIAWYEDGDIWTLTPQGEAKAWLATPAIERYARFSPDGQWLAYSSDVSGKDEVYVRPFPGPGQATQISGGGGDSPQWSKDGRTLYYLQRASSTIMMMQAAVTPGTPFVASKASPASILNPWQYTQNSPYDNKDMLPDGSFVVVLDLAQQKLLNSQENTNLRATDRAQLAAKVPVGEFHVVLNFAEELKERLP